MAFFPKQKKTAENKKVYDKEGYEFYSSDEIRELNAHYNIILGERSNGKTYDAGVHILTDFWTSHCFGEIRQSIYMRRWKEDIRMSDCGNTFTHLVYNGNAENEVEKITGGEYNNIVFKRGAWYLGKFDAETGETTLCPEPFCFPIALSDIEHTKGKSFPYVHTIYFDEFVPSSKMRGHLVDEFSIFMNTVSTVLRRKDDFQVFMLANTIDKQDMYFSEMGLYNIRNQVQGTIESYKYGDTGLTVAVELCGNAKSKKKEKADVFFAFDSPSLQMITKGDWSLEVYPHLPVKYKSTDVISKFFIVYDSYVLQCNIIQKDENCFVYIHPKTTPIKEDDHDLIYSDIYDVRPNWRRNIYKSFSPYERKILQLINMDQVYFLDNPTGQIFHNYLEWCIINR